MNNGDNEMMNDNIVKEKSKSKYIILIIIFVLLVGGVLIYLNYKGVIFNNNQNASNESNSNNQNSINGLNNDENPNSKVKNINVSSISETLSKVLSDNNINLDSNDTYDIILDYNNVNGINFKLELISNPIDEISNNNIINLIVNDRKIELSNLNSGLTDPINEFINSYNISLFENYILLVNDKDSYSTSDRAFLPNIVFVDKNGIYREIKNLVTTFMPLNSQELDKEKCKVIINSNSIVYCQKASVNNNSNEKTKVNYNSYSNGSVTTLNSFEANVEETR